MKPNDAWLQLTDAERRAAITTFWNTDSYCDRGLKEKALDAISIQRNIRRKSVGTLPNSSKTAQLLNCKKLSDELLLGLLRCYFLGSEKPMLLQFLDELHIPHDANGFITDDSLLRGLAISTVDSTVEKLVRQFEPRKVFIYLWILQENDPDSWPSLKNLPKRISLPGNCEVSTIEADSPETDVSPSEAGAQRESNPESLTQLDKMVTLAIVDTASGVKGALPKDEMFSVVQEFLRLNSRRHQSYFHKGYSEAMFDLSLEEHFTEENPSRRLWYSADAIVAFARSAKHEEIVHLVESQDLSPLGSELVPRSAYVAQFIFEALCSCGRGASAAKFLAPALVPYCGLFDLVLNWGTMLLRRMEIENASSVLELLNQALAFYPQDALTKKQLFDLKRRRAHCLRLQRRFTVAQGILEALAKDDVDERSIILTDLALVRIGFRGLLDVVIPEKNVGGFIQNLKTIVPKLEEAVGAGGDPVHAEYCLGVLALATSEREKAVALLERSVTQMIARPAVYDFWKLLSHARFYLALALAENIDSDRADYAVEEFQQALKGDIEIPPALLKRFLEALLMTAPHHAKTAAETLLEKVQLSPKLIESLRDSELPRHSSVVREKLLSYSSEQGRSKKARFSDLRILLKDSLGSSDIEMAARALDEMEELSVSDACGMEFSSLLSKEENYDPAWSKTDASWASVRILERQGQFEEAAEILRKEFYTRLATHEYGSVDEAHDILDKIKVYALPEFDIATLEQRLQPRLERIPSISTAQSTRRVQILVVGGDELEASYDRALESQLAKSDPLLTVSFRHTKWSSNHGQQLEDMRGALDRADAIVVMRRIRTNLGRNVRRNAKLWIGCAGASKSSILNAVQLAADIARNQMAKATTIN